MGNKSSREDDGGICEAKENSFNVFDPCGRCELSPCLCCYLMHIFNIFLCISHPIHISSHMQLITYLICNASTKIRHYRKVIIFIVRDCIGLIIV